MQLWQPLDGLGHGKVVKLVSEHDGAAGGKRAITGFGDDVLIIAIYLRLGDGWRSCAYTPILGIRLPKNGLEVESVGNDTDTVINVTIRWAPAEWGYSGNEFDRLHGVVELRKGLLVGHGGHVRVGPRMDADFMPICDCSLRLQRPVHDVGADVEHGGLEILLVKIVIERVMRAIWPVVKSESIAQRLWDGGDVWAEVGMLGRVTLAVRPPAIRVSSRVGRGEGGKVAGRCALWHDVGYLGIDRSVDRGEKSLGGRISG